MKITDQDQKKLLNLIEKGNLSELSSFFDQFSEEDLKEIINDVYDIGDDKKSTLLNWSLEHGKTEVFDFLVEKGVDLEKSADDGITPLMKACLEDNEDICKKLIAKKVNINQVDKDGDSALMMSFDNDRRETKIAQLLIENGVNVNNANRVSKRAIDYAFDDKNLELIELLFNNGAELKLSEDHYDDLITIFQRNNINKINLRSSTHIGYRKRTYLDNEDFFYDNNFPKSYFYENFSIKSFKSDHFGNTRFKSGLFETIDTSGVVANEIFIEIFERNRKIASILQKNPDLTLKDAKLEWFKSCIEKDEIDIVHFDILSKMIDYDKDGLFLDYKDELNKKFGSFLSNKIEGISFIDHQIEIDNSDSDDEKAKVKDEYIGFDKKAIQIANSRLCEFKGKMNGIIEDFAKTIELSDEFSIEPMLENYKFKNVFYKTLGKILFEDRADFLAKKLKENADDDRKLSETIEQIIDWSKGLNILAGYYYKANDLTISGIDIIIPKDDSSKGNLSEDESSKDNLSEGNSLEDESLEDDLSQGGMSKSDYGLKNDFSKSKALFNSLLDKLDMSHVQMIADFIAEESSKYNSFYSSPCEKYEIEKYIEQRKNIEQGQQIGSSNKRSYDEMVESLELSSGSDEKRPSRSPSPTNSERASRESIAELY